MVRPIVVCHAGRPVGLLERLVDAAKIDVRRADVLPTSPPSVDSAIPIRVPCTHSTPRCESGKFARRLVYNMYHDFALRFQLTTGSAAPSKTGSTKSGLSATATCFGVECFCRGNRADYQDLQDTRSNKKLTRHGKYSKRELRAAMHKPPPCRLNYSLDFGRKWKTQCLVRHILEWLAGAVTHQVVAEEIRHVIDSRFALAADVGR